MGTIRTVTMLNHLSSMSAKTHMVWNFVLGIASTAVSSVTMVLLSIPFIINGIKAFKFTGEIDKAMKDDGTSETQRVWNTVEMLKKRITLQPEEIQEAAKSIAFKEEGELYDLIKDTIVLSDEEHAVLSDKDCASILAEVQNLMDGVDRDSYPLISNWNQVGDSLYARLAKMCADSEIGKRG